MQKIQILMSVYNGEKYLSEQIDSILKQDCEKAGAAWSLFVRDDGSKDSTVQILEEYRRQYPDKISWVQGNNMGVIGSFFELLKSSDAEADYFAFADQDDVWLSGKLRRGIECIKKTEQNKGIPVLYACRPKLVDAGLEALSSEIKRPPMRPSFENALIENIVTGCTAVFNGSLRSILLMDTPVFTPMHDHWLYLTASLFGEVYYDETPYILYRQHGSNVVGNPVSLLAESAERIKKFRVKRRNFSRQTASLLCIYGNPRKEELQKYCLDPAVRGRLSLAKAFLSGKKSLKIRVRLVRSGKLYRQRKNDNRIFKWLLLFGFY